MIVSQNCIDFDTKTYRFGHFSGPSYRGAHAGWLVGGVSGAHRLVLFIQLEVAHKHFRLARPTESAQGGGSNRACYFGTSGGGFGEVSGAYRLVLFIQLEVAHKHFRLARPTESAQGGGSNRAC